MKRTIIATIACLLALHTSWAQPSVMVVPSDKWCQANGFMVKSGNAEYPDYKQALINHNDLLNVISKINIIMSDRGFPLENLETALKNIKTENVERALYTDKEGNSIVSSPLDELYRTASADIILQLTWNVNKVGPKYSITFNLQALDSYTTKQVAGAEGTGAPSFSASVPVLLEEAVISHMDVFCSRLMQHFADMKERGREISLDVCLADGADFNFMTDYDDYELEEIITRMVAKASVNHSFSKAPSTETLLQYRNVRIPLRDNDGIPMNARSFGRILARELKKAPYEMTATVVDKGLGKAILIIGTE